MVVQSIYSIDGGRILLREGFESEILSLLQHLKAERDILSWIIDNSRTDIQFAYSEILRLNRIRDMILENEKNLNLTLEKNEEKNKQ